MIFTGDATILKKKNFIVYFSIEKIDFKKLEKKQ